MAFRVEVSRRAERDLADISAYIQRGLQPQTERWFMNLYQAIVSLEDLPERGALLSVRRKYRQLLFGAKPHVYRIIYSVDVKGKVVAIAHIRHGARTGDGV